MTTRLMPYAYNSAREIQAQEGLPTSIWGPPTSGHSTPLRENIPESPSQDSFPDLIPTTQSLSGTSTGRSSPSDLAGSGTAKAPFGSSTSIGVSRLGAGSPSHELGTRLYPKR